MVARHPNTEVADEPEEHAEIEAEPAPLPPLRVRFNAAVRSGDFASALTLHHDLMEEVGHADHDLAYERALCLEGLAKWSEAEAAFKKLAKMPGLESTAASDLGLIRCRLAAGDRGDAERLLDQVDRRCGHLDRVRAEVVYLRARLALEKLSHSQPGPFAPEAVMWPDIRLAPDQIADWLPLPAVTDPSAGAQPAPPPLQRHPPQPDSDPRAEAERLVRVALEQAAGHPKRNALQLATANFVFGHGRTTEAVRRYQAVRDADPNGPEALAATYNLGLTQFRAWALTQARAAFLEVVDRGVGTPHEGLGWWWVGRVELNLGNPDAALKPWANAAGDREVESAVTLGTILVHLIEGRSEKAAKVFHRVKFSSADPHPALADAFAQFFRYDATESDLRGEALAAAVKAAGYGRPFGPTGQMLFGRWLLRTGRPDEAAAVFEAGAESAPGAWGVRLTWETAELLYASGHSEAARRRYLAVAAADADELGTRSLVRLAEMAVRKADGTGCLRLCRTALGRASVDRDDVLRLMGRGYELLDRPREAAECFAGRVPAR